MKPILKNRTGKECKKTDCDNYNKRNPFGYDSRLEYCRECKHAYPSQYTKIKKELE
jgi:hypothetical protein